MLLQLLQKNDISPLTSINESKHEQSQLSL